MSKKLKTKDTTARASTMEYNPVDTVAESSIASVPFMAACIILKADTIEWCHIAGATPGTSIGSPELVDSNSSMEYTKAEGPRLVASRALGRFGVVGWRS